MADFSSLKTRYYGLDFSKELSQLHLEKFSRRYGIYWKRLPPYLQLQTVVVADIDKKPVDEEEKRREFLQQWKGIKGSDATYERLVLALLETGSRSDAEGLCRVMQEEASGKL